MLDISFQKGSTRFIDLNRWALKANPHAWYELAKCYWYGNLIPANQYIALKYYKQSAQQDHAGACLELGKIYLKGQPLLGIAADSALAKYYFTKAKNTQEDYFTPEDQRLHFIKQAKLYLRAIKLTTVIN